MDTLDELLQEAGKRGFIDEAAISKELRSVDPDDLRALAKKLHKWQSTLIDGVAGRLRERTDLDNPDTGIVRVLRAGLLRGALSRKQFKGAQNDFKRRTKQTRFLDPHAATYDMKRYVEVLSNIDSKIKARGNVD